MKDIKGFEGLYQIDNNGNIFGLKRKKYLSIINFDKDGYPIAGLCKNGKITRKAIHRWVALTYLPNPKNLPEVNHKNCIKTDNNPDNLEWCTSMFNIEHADLNNLRKGLFGENNNHNKLSEQDVREIRLLQGHLLQREIGMMYGVTKECIGLIHKRINWKWLL